jgi:hypothetical protein
MSFRALYTENLKLKALSLLFAAVLSLFVALKAKDEVEIPIRVNFISLPDGLTLKEPVQRQLTLRMTGPRLLLMKQQSRGVSISLDLSGLAGGRVSFSSLERYLTLYDGITPLRVSPATVELDLVRVGKAGQAN